MRLVSLAPSSALLAMDIVRKGEFTEPLMSYLQHTAKKVATIALRSIPFVSVLMRNYHLICEVLKEMQQQIICFEKKWDHPPISQSTSKEVGAFFAAKNPFSFGFFSNERTWNVHHEDFKKLSIEEIELLLQKVFEHTPDPHFYQAQVAQILTKRLVAGCWNQMQEGLEIKIPVLDEAGNKKLAVYVLDKKFDLWQDIPAFGFKEVQNKEAPLLIFRCTNPNTDFADSWPSLLANLHPKGPAWKLYEQSHEKIEKWLDEVTETGTVKARLMGYSQGAALASYFLTYQGQWISKKEHEASFLFAGPGISKSVYQDWNQLADPPWVYHYVTRGDFVPKVGEGFIGKVFEISDGARLSPALAHRSLSLLSPHLNCYEVDLPKELRSSIRQAFSSIQRNASHYLYPLFRLVVVPKIQKVFYKVHFSS